MPDGNRRLRTAGWDAKRSDVPMAWFLLLLAGICEMAWPIGFKYTNGFKTHLWAVALTMGIMLLSFVLMGGAVRRGIHIGTAYAVWTGIGATGTALLGIWLFREPSDLVRMICLALIILGVIGLKFFSPSPTPGNASAAVSDIAGARGADA
jgi:quaternary ammonium compound-resistance protein SugE